MLFEMTLLKFNSKQLTEAEPVLGPFSFIRVCLFRLLMIVFIWQEKK